MAGLTMAAMLAAWEAAMAVAVAVAGAMAVMAVAVPRSPSMQLIRRVLVHADGMTLWGHCAL